MVVELMLGEDRDAKVGRCGAKWSVERSGGGSAELRHWKGER